MLNQDTIGVKTLSAQLDQNRKFKDPDFLLSHTAQFLTPTKLWEPKHINLMQPKISATKRKLPLTLYLKLHKYNPL